MGGRYQEMTPKRIARLIKEGYGQGEGDSYRPWFRAPEIPSSGRLVRTQSLITGRVMHMASETEARAQLRADFTRGMVNQKEQALCDFGTTLEIARRLKVRHPRAWKGHAVPMSTDFVLTLDDELGRREVAVAVKTRGELEGSKAKRVAEKLAIEEVYHTTKGRKFLLVTDDQLNLRVTANLQWLSEGFRRGSHEISTSQQAAFELAFPAGPANGTTIMDRIQRAAQSAGLSIPMAIDAFRRAVWKRRVRPDLTQWVRLNSAFVPSTHPDLGVELPWSR